MTTRKPLTIGETINLLKDEFPDVTVSKVRFLESQGLIDPERTPSGYRKFFDDGTRLVQGWLDDDRGQGPAGG